MTPFPLRDYALGHSPTPMCQWLPSLRFILLRGLLAFALCAAAALAARAQDSSSEGTTLRGNRPEIALTVRDSSGQPIAAAAT
ncbi:MAG TPA: hypothetical protein VJP87_11690, partial [Candidatus Acidoferrales bacterium]|nr:hypothetical protein [Candidatus Acidoferrales bacterium]